MTYWIIAYGAPLLFWWAFALFAAYMWDLVLRTKHLSLGRQLLTNSIHANLGVIFVLVSDGGVLPW